MKMFLFLFVSLISNIVMGQWTVNDVPNPKSYGQNGYVSSPDGILTKTDFEHIDQICLQIEEADTFQVAFVILQSIGTETPKDFAGRLFNHWRIGHAGRDDGLLVLFVMDQRRIEFETGYGTETVLSDYECVQIQQEFMVPYFKKEAYGEGCVLGAEAIQNALSGKVLDLTKLKPKIASVRIDSIQPVSDEQLAQLLNNTDIAKSNYISAIEYRNEVIVGISNQFQNDHHQKEIKKSIDEYDFDQINASENKVKLTLLAAYPLILPIFQKNEELRVRAEGANNRMESEKRRYEQAVDFYNLTRELSDPDGNFEPIEAHE